MGNRQAVIASYYSFFFQGFITVDATICGYFNKQVNSAMEAMTFGCG